MAIAPNKYTVSGLSAELKRDRRTIGTIIEEGGVEPCAIGKTKSKIKYYRMADVVNAMMGDQNLDLTQERAKLTKKQAEKTELQIGEIKGQLIDIESVKESWAKQITACRAKLLSIPTKVTPLVIVAKDQNEVKAILKAQVHEALSELVN